MELTKAKVALVFNSLSTNKEVDNGCRFNFEISGSSLHYIQVAEDVQSCRALIRYFKIKRKQYSSSYQHVPTQ